MERIPIRSVLLTAGFLTFVAVNARANTITPSPIAWTPGSAIVYGARLSSGELHPGDGFTIFDIGGFTGFGAIAPSWSAASGSGSIFSLPSQGLDNPFITNVTFTYTGAAVEANFGDISFWPFTVLTSSTALTTDDWVSRDHLLAQPFVIDGGIGSAHRDDILVPASGVSVTAVPDGGSTLALLGLGFLAVGTVRRSIPA